MENFVDKLLSVFYIITAATVILFGLINIVRAIVSGSANVFTIILFTAMSYLGVGLLKCAIDECRKL